jgi:ygbB family
MRIGQGYDVHAVQEDRKLILGGVEIPHKWGLKGHSDADVLLHAVMDALLGAAGLGDIGKHFPDTDNKYKDISSMVLLEEVAKLLYEHTYIVENIDATIVAQEPKLLPYMEAMKENIAKVLSISKNQINIKATTEEWLGFTGRVEGIKSYAVCLLTSVRDASYVDVTPGNCGGCCSKI